MHVTVASRYVLLVSLYDRLGGHVLRWSKLKGHQWGTSTVPVDHQGHYYNTDIKVRNAFAYSTAEFSESVKSVDFVLKNFTSPNLAGRSLSQCILRIVYTILSFCTVYART